MGKWALDVAFVWKAVLTLGLVLLYYCFSIGITFYNKWLTKVAGGLAAGTGWEVPVLPVLVVLQSPLQSPLQCPVSRRCHREGGSWRRQACAAVHTAPAVLWAPHRASTSPSS